MKEWHYNEYKQVGINFENEEEVRIYDEKFKKQRNVNQELQFIKDVLGISNEHIILEIGTGTGEFAIGLSKFCKKVIAADVSKTMLSYTEKKINALGIKNIELLHGGFLYEGYAANSFNSVISSLALHHLPDFWKLVAMKNIYNILKPGGKFLLTDCILSFDMNSYDENISGFIETERQSAGEKIAEEIIVNIRDEYPTYDWVIKDMLIKEGFNILTVLKHTDLISTVICEK